MKQGRALALYAFVFVAAVFAMIVAEWIVLISSELLPYEFWNEPLPLGLFLRLGYPLLMFLTPAAAAFIASYLLLKMFRQRGLITPPVWLPLFMVGLSPFIACSAFMGFMMYQSATFPSPAPYSGAAVKKVWSDIGHGQYDVVTYEYTIDLSLEELKRHYNAEMQQYCAHGWEFAPTHLDCQGFAQCYTAECEIPRPFVKEAQFFSVYLRSISETQTNVLYFVKDQTF